MAAIAALVASSMVSGGSQVRAEDSGVTSLAAQMEDPAPQPDQYVGQVQMEGDLPPGTIPVQIVGVDVVEPVGADGIDFTFSLLEFDDRANMIGVEVVLDSGERFVWSSRSEGAEHVAGSGLVMLELGDEFHGWLESPYYGVVGVTDEAQLSNWEVRARLMTVGGEPYLVNAEPVEAIVRFTVEKT